MLLKRTTTRGLKSRVLTFSGFTSKGLITFKYPGVLDPGVLYIQGLLHELILHPLDSYVQRYYGQGSYI